VPHPIAVCFGSDAEVLRLAPVIHEMRRRGVPAVGVAAGPVERALATFEIGAGAPLRRVPAAAVVVQADTPTASWATRAACARGIPVAQVEAGLRAARFTTGPDRPLAAPPVTWHFAPTVAARSSLLSHGVDPGRIHVSGGTVADAARWIAARDGLRDRRPAAGALRVVVALRRGAPRALGAMLARLAERADVELVQAGPAGVPAALATHDNVSVVAAQSYERLVAALASAHLVLAGEPSAQETATALGVPALPIGATAEPRAILQRAERLLDDDALHRSLAGAPRPGGGAGRIVARLARDLAAVPRPEIHGALLAA
jgi:UDP-N-acetylglucosamine 2-epimerase (non-hydrolysing)